jgi:GNAT superfamily N-acetyltransferase
MLDDIALAAKPSLTDCELNTLFTAAWPHHRQTRFAPVLAHSLTWIAARRHDRLIGFVNVATDGGTHAFVLDTTVHPEHQRRGLGRQLITTAVEQARNAGIAWLHVDYEPHLDGFYRSCGFRPTTAGLLRLN